MRDFEGPVIFVGGAPRSGTTVTHALLCTSARTHRYCPEVSFLQPLFNAYRVGMDNWSIHTGAFFSSKDHFTDRMGDNIRSLLADVSGALDNPDVLCVKDPLLTPLFYWVHRLLGPQAKLITVVRHPFDIVRSRQEVIERMGRPFTAANVHAVASEINASYAHLNVPVMQNAVFPIRYEDLSQPGVIDALRSFTMLPDISAEKVWSEQAEPAAAALKNPWYSPKYHRPISFESRLSPLAADFRAVVASVCAPLMQRFGYDEPVAAGEANR